MKKLILLSALSVAILATPANAQQSAETEYTVKLTGTQLNQIAAGLQELPAKFANPLWQHIQTQVNAQNEAAKKKAEEKK